MSSKSLTAATAAPQYFTNHNDYELFKWFKSFNRFTPFHRSRHAGLFQRLHKFQGFESLQPSTAATESLFKTFKPLRSVHNVND